MKHFAVTITRTCGAGGTSIAKILSAHYGIEYYDRMTQVRRTGDYEQRHQ